MSYYIIIRGPLGSGKTTISEKLAQKLNAEHIGMDEVLEKNGLDKTPPDASGIPAKNFIKANEIVLPEAKSLLSAGKIVIFDACFYHKEVIEHLIQNLPFPHYIFTLKVPLEVCVERDSQRPMSYGEGAAEAVFGLVSKFDYGININANQNLDKTINEIIIYLPHL